MRIVHNLEFQTDSKEEKLPYDTPGFPYLASRAELDFYREPFVPWHWHNAIELFYMESGELNYYTPHKNIVFPAGSAGMVNANVLHKTQIQARTGDNIQLLHIFDPQLLAGTHGSLVEQKYISPIINSSQIELIALSRIWIELFQICAPLLKEKPQTKNITTDKVKSMMVYIHEHFTEKITIVELASAVFLSERECYRVFQSHLHMTPVDYIKSYRIQVACQMLAKSQMPVTEIGSACGMENPSYFGKVFREATGYTPRQYRRKWQDKNTI